MYLTKKEDIESPCWSNKPVWVGGEAISYVTFMRQWPHISYGISIQ